MTRRSSPVAPPRTREILITPAAVLDRVMARWRASLASCYSPDDIDGFIRRNRPARRLALQTGVCSLQIDVWVLSAHSRHVPARRSCPTMPASRTAGRYRGRAPGIAAPRGLDQPSPTGDSGVMGTAAEDWGRLIVMLAKVVLEVSGEGDRRRQGHAVCSLCQSGTQPLLAVARGKVCPLCTVALNFNMMKDKHAQALFAELARAGLSVGEFAEGVKKLISDLEARTAEVEALHRAADSAETELADLRTKVAEFEALWHADLRAKAAEGAALRQSEIDLAAAQLACASLTSQLDLARREAETLRQERDSRVPVAVNAAADLLAVPWMMEFKPRLHPRIFQHILDLIAFSSSSAMAKAIEGFFQGTLHALSKGITTLQGSTRDVIDTLEKAGCYRPESYSGRILSWLVRRTPLVARNLTSPIVYVVQLEWLMRPPQECLEHHQLRRPR